MTFLPASPLHPQAFNLYFYLIGYFILAIFCKMDEKKSLVNIIDSKCEIKQEKRVRTWNNQAL